MSSLEYPNYSRNSNSSDTSKTDELRKGDIVLNGYQSEPYNMYLVVGSTSRKTGLYSRTTYYKTQHIIDGELLEGQSLFSKQDNKLTRIGYIKVREVMRRAIQDALGAGGERNQYPVAQTKEHVDRGSGFTHHDQDSCGV